MAGKVLTGACGVVLVGGEGRRIGGRKELLRLPGGSLLERVLSVLGECFARVLVVGRRPGELDLPPGVRAVPDEFPGSGPLGGIATGLDLIEEEWGFFCACDMPCLSGRSIRGLWKKALGLEGGAVVPRMRGRPEPLHAFYSASCRDAAAKLVRSGKRAPRALFDRTPVLYVEVDPGSPDALSLTNINTPEDLRRFLSTTDQPPCGAQPSARG